LSRNSKNITIKVPILGDAAVGKTTLRRKYMGYGFRKDYSVTLGAGFTSKKIKLGDYHITFSIWDIAGQHKDFEDMKTVFLRGSRCAIIVFDITNPSSFNNLYYWVEQITNYGGFIPMVICGNKTDLRKKIPETIASERGEEFSNKLAEKIGVETTYIETSALTGKNVDNVFLYLGSVMIKQIEDRKSKLVLDGEEDDSNWLVELGEEKED